MNKNLTKTSKFLSLVLRHKPETIGLQLDSEGWLVISELLAAASEHGRSISRSELDEVVFSNDKQRFAFSDDGLRIRANQGHSVDINLALQPVEPPAILYHGTVARFADAIQAEGLIKKERQHVHLSADVETAQRVGQRRGKPIVLKVDAQQMHVDGCVFYRSQNGVWLTDTVASRYLAWPT